MPQLRDCWGGGSGDVCRGRWGGEDGPGWSGTERTEAGSQTQDRDTCTCTCRLAHGVQGV